MGLTKKKSKKAIRRGKPNFFRRLSLFLTNKYWWQAFLYSFLLIVLPGTFWYKGYPQQMTAKLSDSLMAFSQKIGFSIKEILVEGRQTTERATILKTINLKPGDPIFQVNLEEIRQRLEQERWVRKAIVLRWLPSTIWIQLIERKPIAVWQHQKKFFLIDEESLVIMPIAKALPNLPLVVGKDAPLYVPRMLQILDSFAMIKKLTSALVCISGRRWNLILQDNTEVRLPAKDVEKALAKLANLLEEKKLDIKEVQLIDLRLPAKIILQLSPLASANLRSKGKET